MNELNNYKVWTAIITPMLEDQSVDFESFERLLRAQADSGNALVILGSTGESLSFSLEEKQAILDFVIDLNLGLPLMVGVGGIYLPDQLAWIKYLNTIAVNAYLVPVPYYTKPGRIGQQLWFGELMDASDRPVCVYNVPGRTAVKLDPVALSEIATHKNFWAIKEASGSLDDFKMYSAAAPNAHMLSGDDPMFAEFSRHGASGVVSVASNVWPQQVHEIAEQFSTGNFDNEELFAQASRALFSASNPIPTKAILASLGIIKTAITRPPLSADDMKDLDTLTGFDQKIKQMI